MRRTLGTLCQAEEPALYQICTRCGEKMSVILNILSSRFVGYAVRGAQLQVGVKSLELGQGIFKGERLF